MRFECFDVFSINVESTLVLQRMAIHTLVIDCDGRKRNNSHFTLEESVAAAKSLRAQKVFSATFILRTMVRPVQSHPLPVITNRFIAWACRALWAATMQFAKNLRGKKNWT
jgi:hypothetical protein